ncbi:MAG: ferritin family protein [Deltaproteobacteria bacterium]|nr:ferritin family protein [Deltaproteobacteria bacterium]
MNIYGFAMQMEKDGENYYRQLAEQSGSAGLKKIFVMLANEEVKHYHVVELLSKKSGSPQMAETKVLENVKNIFVEMRATKDVPHIDTTTETQSYRKARDLEEESRKFYLEKAGQAENEEERRILLQLAGEEGKHLRIMENIVDFVSRPEPGHWLENAEWHHLLEY